MAADEDDLDAFFDDVDKVADEAVAEEEKKTAAISEQDTTVPPSKKVKRSHPVIRPQGVVVAAASSYKKTTETITSPTQQQDKIAPTANVVGNASQMIGPFPSSGNNSTSMAYPQASITTPTAAGGYEIGPAVSGGQPAMPNHNNNTNTQEGSSSSSKKPSTHIRTAGGKTWVDKSLEDWPDNDFRIFVGNLGNDVTDVQLFEHFAKYSSLLRAKVVRDAKLTAQQQTQQGGGGGGQHKKSDSKGYGFVSFENPIDCAKALREMDQTWLGSRPIRIKRSTWKDRELKHVRKNEKRSKKHQKKRGLL